MSWKLEYSDKAFKQLRKMDAPVRTILLSWLDKNVDGCEDHPERDNKMTEHRLVERNAIGTAAPDILTGIAGIA